MNTRLDIAKIAAHLTTGPEAYIVTLPAASHDGPFPFMAEFDLAPRVSEQLTDDAYQAVRAEQWPDYSDRAMDVETRTYRPLARLALLDPPTRVVAALTAQLLDRQSTGRIITSPGYPARAVRTLGEYPDYTAHASIEFSKAGIPTGPAEVLNGSRDCRRHLPLARMSIVGTTAYGLNVVTFRELPEADREDIATGAMPLVNLSRSPARSL